VKGTRGGTGPEQRVTNKSGATDSIKTGKRNAGKWSCAFAGEMSHGKGLAVQRRGGGVRYIPTPKGLCGKKRAKEKGGRRGARSAACTKVSRVQERKKGGSGLKVRSGKRVEIGKGGREEHREAGLGTPQQTGTRTEKVRTQDRGCSSAQRKKKGQRENLGPTEGQKESRLVGVKGGNGSRKKGEHRFIGSEKKGEGNHQTETIRKSSEKGTEGGREPSLKLKKRTDTKKKGRSLVTTEGESTKIDQ